MYFLCDMFKKVQETVNLVLCPSLYGLPPIRNIDACGLYLSYCTHSCLIGLYDSFLFFGPLHFFVEKGKKRLKAELENFVKCS